MKDPLQTTKDFYNQHGRALWTNRKTNSFYCESQFTEVAALWPEGGDVLDIGCAAGLHVPLFLGIGRHVHYHGLDSSEEFLIDAKRRYPHLPFTEGSITDKEIFPENQFVGFWANSVLMHIPFNKWNELFTNLEHICIPGAYAYLSLPIAHPNPDAGEEDTRHFTLLDESEQKQFLLDQNWDIAQNGSFDGFTSTNVWRWYIVQLPQ